MNIGIFSPISSLLPKNDHAEIVECIEQCVQGLDFWNSYRLLWNKTDRATE